MHINKANWRGKNLIHKLSTTVVIVILLVYYPTMIMMKSAYDQFKAGTILQEQYNGILFSFLIFSVVFWGIVGAIALVSNDLFHKYQIKIMEEFGAEDVLKGWGCTSPGNIEKYTWYLKETISFRKAPNELKKFVAEREIELDAESKKKTQQTQKETEVKNTPNEKEQKARESAEFQAKIDAFKVEANSTPTEARPALLTKADLDKMTKSILMLKQSFSWKNYASDISYDMVILYTPYSFKDSILFLTHYKTTKEGINVKFKQGTCLLEIISRANWKIPMAVWTGSPGIGTFVNNMIIDEAQVKNETIKTQEQLLAKFTDMVDIEKAKADTELQGKRNVQRVLIETQKIYEEGQREMFIKKAKQFSKTPETTEEAKTNAKVPVDKKLKAVLYIIGLIGAIIIAALLLSTIKSKPNIPSTSVIKTLWQLRKLKVM